MIGRFLQEDTYRGDGLNLYAYCANNPVVYYDPSGHTTTTTTPACGTGSNKEPEKVKGDKAKTGPKPKGTGPYNKKIEEIGNQITDGDVIAGGGKSSERKISTPNGKKSSRRPDGSRYGINVGRTTAGGAPVKREVEAFYDLEDADLPMYFVGYDK